MQKKNPKIKSITWPNQFKNTGEANRRSALEEFTIKAVTKGSLADGDELVSYFGQVITTNYYVYRFIRKTQNADGSYDGGTFYCGNYAAESDENKGWQRLLKEPNLKLVSICESRNGTSGGIGANKGAVDNCELSGMHFSKQLLLEICLVLLNMFKKIDPNSALLDISIKLQSDEWSKKPVFPSYIKSVNTVLKNSGGVPFTERVKKARSNGKRYKFIDVSYFNEQLALDGIESFY